MGLHVERSARTLELHAMVRTNSDDTVAGQVDVAERQAALLCEHSLRVGPDRGDRSALIESGRQSPGHGGLALQILELLQTPRRRWKRMAIKRYADRSPSRPDLAEQRLDRLSVLLGEHELALTTGPPRPPHRR
ncbi:hypothetical protein [Nannocystis sp.]|uniref:hypothetical protein n=1 Tax=Nannocystis sp. TaxID=1962667 RepID=UPI0025F65D53|nr:hypothetical protein [Nannocystis sp.]MBK7827215.1 hypothetical protein [Nannocystis sp.]